MSLARIGVAALLVLIGIVWIGQGLNVIGGSAMSGQPFWAVMGGLCLVVGAVLAWTTRRAAVR